MHIASKGAQLKFSGGKIMEKTNKALVAVALLLVIIWLVGSMIRRQLAERK